MRIAVIGDDICGLLAAHMIARHQHEPVIFHTGPKPVYDHSLDLKRRTPGLSTMMKTRTVHAFLMMEFLSYMKELPQINKDEVRTIRIDYPLVFGPEEYDSIEVIGPDPNDVVPQVLGVLTSVGLGRKEEL